jgi:hypothetical protein
MPTLFCSLASLAVASLYYYWRGYHECLLRRQKTLRERVTYMLWVMANTV